jgi:UDP-N-acetylbacillosamine N-acetyltransferase
MQSEHGARPKIVIWGASGHGRVVADIVVARGAFELAGFIDDVREPGTRLLGAPLLGNRSALEGCRRHGVSHLLVGVGDCKSRLALAAQASAMGFALGSAVHPRAVVAPDAVIGPGSVVAAGAVINTGATLGSSTIVNTSASVDHECVIGDGVHIGPGAHLGGRVSVGRGTWIGIGAIVSDRITIGTGSIIGAGAVVVRNIPDHVVAFGVPARVHRNLDLL